MQRRTYVHALTSSITTSVEGVITSENVMVAAVLFVWKYMFIIQWFLLRTPPPVRS